MLGFAYWSKDHNTKIGFCNSTAINFWPLTVIAFQLFIVYENTPLALFIVNTNNLPSCTNKIIDLNWIQTWFLHDNLN